MMKSTSCTSIITTFLMTENRKHAPVRMLRSRRCAHLSHINKEHAQYKFKSLSQLEKLF